ncbi:MAG: pilin [Candidatus Roizmanbacteria bacterium]|nr:pilin [Candidatus Roizmanbacteria bacterium]
MNLTIFLVGFFILTPAIVHAGWEVDETVFNSILSVKLQIYGNDGKPLGGLLTMYDKTSPITTKLIKGRQDGSDEVFIPLPNPLFPTGSSEPEALVPIGIYDGSVKYEVIITVDKTILGSIPGGVKLDEEYGIYLQVDPPGYGGAQCLTGIPSAYIVGVEAAWKNDAICYSGYKKDELAKRESNGIYTFKSPLIEYEKERLFRNNDGLDLELGVCQASVCGNRNTGRRTNKKIQFPESVYLIRTPQKACNIELIQFVDGDDADTQEDDIVKLDSFSNQDNLFIQITNLDVSAGDAKISIDGDDSPFPAISFTDEDWDGDGEKDDFLIGASDTNQFKNLSVGRHLISVDAGDIPLCSREIPVYAAGTTPTSIPTTFQPTPLPTTIPGFSSGTTDLKTAETIVLCASLPKASDCTSNDAQDCIETRNNASTACQNCAEGRTLANSAKGIWTAVGCLPTDPSLLISQLFTVLSGIMGGFLLICIIWNGFSVMTSAGNPEALKKAQESITSCVIGFIVLLFAILIIRIIGVDILQLPWFGPGPTPSGA